MVSSMNKNYNLLDNMESDQFYVTVCSNNNNELFDNTNSRFRNRLYKPINLPQKYKYECALVQLSYQINDNPINLHTAPILLDTREKIIVHKPTPISYNIIKSNWFMIGALPQRLFGELRNASKHLKYFAVTQNYDTTGRFKVGIEIDMPVEHSLYMTQLLADLLGLESVYSANGTYEAKHILSESRIQSAINLLDSLEITVVKYSKKELDLESVDDTSLDSIAEVINNAFLNDSVNANIVFADSLAVLSLKDPYVLLELPKSINVPLGFPADFKYKAGTYKASVHHLQYRRSREHILVLGDFIADQYYCSSLLPIFKVLPLEVFKNTFITFDNPHYVDVRKRFISEIEVSFLNQNFEETKLGIETHPVTAVFHFRKKNHEG